MTCEVVRGDVNVEEEIPQEKAEIEGWSGGDTSVAPFPNRMGIGKMSESWRKIVRSPLMW